LFVDLDLLKKPLKPQLFIAKPNREIIGKLKESYDKKLTLSLSELNELSFSIPYKIDIRNILKDNPNINKIKDRYLIKLVLGNYTEWYIINNITDDSNEKGDFKQVHAFSLGHELNDKLISGYKCTSYNITQVTADILSGSIWSIGYVDATFDTMFRSFEFNLNKALECIYKITETFGALVVWDTENRLINFYKFDLYGTDKGLTITENKYLKALQKESNSDEMVTRLKVYGKDNLSIQKVNPTGANYIEDFSYFMYPFERDENKNVLQHSDYMSDGLCHAILDYQELIEENTETFGDLLGQKNILLTQKATLENELYSLQEQLYVILDNLDIAQAQGTSTTQLKQQRNSKQLEIEDKLAEINNVDDEIDDIDTQILDLKTTLSIENNFTPEQIIERNQFIIEKEWRDENYIDEMDLYNDAVKRFAQLREPQVAYELDIVDFLSVVAEQRDWNKLNLGDVIRVRKPQLNIDIKTKIIKIDFDFDNSGIKLTIANSKKIISDENKYWESFYKSVSTSTTVDMNKFKWDETATTTSIINEILNNTWESAKRSIVSGVNESVTIDRRGITLTSVDNPNHIIRMLSSVIGLSQDGGNTFKTAINAEGIYAERLVGQIIAGTNLSIVTEDSSFTVDSTGVKIKGSALTIEGGLPASQIDAEGSGLVTLDNDFENGIRIDSVNGIIATRSDNKIRTILNAIDGIKIQSHDGVGWVDRLYADINGNLKVQNVDVKGNIDCSTLKINGVSALTTNDKISVDAIEDLVVGGNVTMGSNATISWSKVLNKPSDLAYLDDIPTLPSYIKSTKITSTTIESPRITGGTITGGTIVGGEITSNTNINVTQDVRIGNKLILNPKSHLSGIQWGEGGNSPAIYYDPGGKSITIGGGVNGGIYAKAQRLDVPPVAVFG